MNSVHSQTMEIELKTLTPLWTGGVDAGKMDRIRESGILGSLRWWFEILVRGVGGMVNDPTDDSGLDLKKYDALTNEKKQDPECLRKAGLCDVSQIFGATNWKRKFRLEIESKTTPAEKNLVSDKIELAEEYCHDGITPTWFFSNKPQKGYIKLKITALSRDFNTEIIGGLIQFIADWGALGARTQMGFGLVAPLIERIDTRPLHDHLMGIKGSPADTTVPSLKNMFFAKIKTKNGHAFSETDPFILKYNLRQLFAQHRSDQSKNEEKNIRHFIMGSIGKDTTAAKIKMSRTYEENKTIRLWGWIPENAKEYCPPWNRELIINKIYNYLQENYDLQSGDWKEFQHPTVHSQPKDMDHFLSELLCVEEESK